MKKEFIVQNMSCQHCVDTITAHFVELGFKVEIDLVTKKLILEKDMVDDEFVTEELADLGF